MILHPCQNNDVPIHSSALKWVELHICNGSAVDHESSEPSRITRTLENVKAVRESSLQSAQHSAGKHATTFGLSARIVRQV